MEGRSYCRSLVKYPVKHCIGIGSEAHSPLVKECTLYNIRRLAHTMLEQKSR